MAGERKSKDNPVVDHALIRELAQLLDETGLTEIEFERDGQRCGDELLDHVNSSAPGNRSPTSDVGIASNQCVHGDLSSRMSKMPASRARWWHWRQSNRVFFSSSSS